MKGLTKILIGSAISIAMATAASAQTMSNAAVTGNGYAVLSQSTTLNCDVTVSADAGTTTKPISSRSITPGDASCIVVVPHGAWSMAVVPGDATKLSLTLGANTIMNEPCYGTVIGDWDNSTKILTITNKTLPPVDPTHQTCTILNAGINIPGLNVS